jgi:hypothetical protein
LSTLFAVLTTDCAEIRNLKFEIRNPKSEGNPKPEARNLGSVVQHKGLPCSRFKPRITRIPRIKSRRSPFLPSVPIRVIRGQKAFSCSWCQQADRVTHLPIFSVRSSFSAFDSDPDPDPDPKTRPYYRRLRCSGSAVVKRPFLAPPGSPRIMRRNPKPEARNLGSVVQHKGLPCSRFKPRITRIPRIKSRRSPFSPIRAHPCNPWSKGLFLLLVPTSRSGNPFTHFLRQVVLFGFRFRPRPRPRPEDSPLLPPAPLLWVSRGQKAFSRSPWFTTDHAEKSETRSSKNPIQNKGLPCWLVEPRITRIPRIKNRRSSFSPIRAHRCHPWSKRPFLLPVITTDRSFLPPVNIGGIRG